MRFQPVARRGRLIAAVAAGLGIFLAGCGSSSPSTPKSSSSPGAMSAVAQIKANWVAFFNASTPVAKRVQLLQNGQLFQSLIAAQAKSSLASSASAKVLQASNVTSSQATVKYSILVAGQPALSNQAGVAVHQGGIWKVGLASFCGLLTLEKSSGLIKLPALPAACKSAG
jgi:hypothetical protein